MNRLSWLVTHAGGSDFDLDDCDPGDLIDLDDWADPCDLYDLGDPDGLDWHSES